MCNLYSQTRAVDAMRQLFLPEPFENLAGNLPEQPEIYPDQLAPVIRATPDGLLLARARWGLPTPPQYLAGKKTDRGVTNIRNAASPHWRRWLGPANRCLVPLTAFAEPDARNGGNVWFAPTDDRPVFFAGVFVPGWTSVRKLKDGPTTDDLFAFLTTESAGAVAEVHPKAMPLLLTDRQAWAAWLAEPWPEASRIAAEQHDPALVERVQGGVAAPAAPILPGLALD